MIKVEDILPEKIPNRTSKLEAHLWSAKLVRPSAWGNYEESNKC